MKTAVSIPDDVFERAERLAKPEGKSRSQLYCDAVREYLLRHSPDEITERLNRAIDEIGNEGDPFVAEAARQTLIRSEW